MHCLYLVRHGRPRVDERRPAHEWLLADHRDPALLQLRDAGVLPLRARWVSSPEPKALATAHALSGLPVELCADLREQARSPRWYDDESEFAATVSRAVTRPAEAVEPGWEPAEATRARVAGAVRRLAAETDGDLVLVGHGTAWTLLVAELTGADPDLESWRAMRMPDWCALMMSGQATEVIRPWGLVGTTP